VTEFDPGLVSADPPDAAVASGAGAVALFADQHGIAIPPSLREDLARKVLSAAWPHITSSRKDGSPEAA
jgi:hypothetical protein